MAEMGGDTAQLRRLLSAVGENKRLRYVEPIEHMQLFHRRNDPFTTTIDPRTNVPYEWPFSRVRVDRAMNVSRGDPAILVGILDTGWSPIPDLAGKVAESWYFTSQSPDAFDREGHGTFVASLIAANNDDGRGLAGFCGSCRLIVFRDTQLTQVSASTAVRQLTDRGVRVMNLSFGGPGISSLFADALQYAISRGVLIVASTGNDGGPNVSYPAAYLQPANGALGYGLAVGASDINNNRASFSTWGSRLSLVAPGTYDSSCNIGVAGALPPVASEIDPLCYFKWVDPTTGSRYAYLSGTSFSAPEVAGIAALVWAARPSLKNYELADILEKSASRPVGSGWSPTTGWGVVDAAAAVELATGRSSADVLSLSELAFSGPPQGGSDATATATATFQDGVPLDSGDIRCDAGVDGNPILPTEAVMSAGQARCRWPIPAAAGSKILTGRVTVTDPYSGVWAIRDFQQQIQDVLAPSVTSLPGIGKWGARISLRYRIAEETGLARVQVRVYRNTTPVYGIVRQLGPAETGRLYAASWKAPKQPLKGPLKFCVRAWDAANNASGLSCSPLRMR
jgi:hypothetical protein